MQTINRVVWVNGCFDILHRGHIELFKFAKQTAGENGKVIVGIDTDKRVSLMKGTTRPFNCQKDRKYVLESIGYIDNVYVFGDDSQLKNLIKVNKCDTMIVGSDWKGKPVIGSELVANVFYFERIENYSTTRILESKRDVCI